MYWYYIPENEERSEGEEDNFLWMCGHQKAITVVALSYQVGQGAGWRATTILSHFMHSSGHGLEDTEQ